MQVLIFKLNGVEYGILLKDVEFISENKNVVKMQNALEAVSGIVMLRGKAVPVYNLASRFGFMEQENRYLLVVKLDDIKIALEVSMIDRVIWIEKEDVISLPAVVRATQMCFREALIYGEILIGLLDIGGLVPQQDRRTLYLSVKKYAEEMSHVEGILYS